MTQSKKLSCGYHLSNNNFIHNKVIKTIGNNNMNTLKTTKELEILIAKLNEGKIKQDNIEEEVRKMRREKLAKTEESLLIG